MVIRKKKLSEPPKSKIISYLAQLRKEKYGDVTVSASEIRTWCESRKVPSNEENMYVLRHYIVAESYDPAKQDLKVVVSTRRLMRNVFHSNKLQTDGTFKLVWQGYPILIVGSTDKKKHIPPIRIGGVYRRDDR